MKYIATMALEIENEPDPVNAAVHAQEILSGGESFVWEITDEAGNKIWVDTETGRVIAQPDA